MTLFSHIRLQNSTKHKNCFDDFQNVILYNDVILLKVETIRNIIRSFQNRESVYKVRGVDFKQTSHKYMLKNVTCKSKLWVDPAGECFVPYLECCDICPLDDRSLRVWMCVGKISSSPSELSMLGGCSLSSGGSGNFFGNIGVSSVFSIDWNCDECLLALKSAAFAKYKHQIWYVLCKHHTFSQSHRF